MIHPYDPQAAMNAKYEAFARKDAATARRLQADPAGRAIEEAQQRIAAKLAARAPRVGEIQRIPADPFRSELVSIAAGLLHVCGEDPGEDEKLRIAAVRLRDLADGAAPRASQAAGEPHSTGCGSRAAHDPHGGSAGHTEPRVHYEVEMYNDGWSIPIYRTDSLDDARAHEEPAVTSASIRVVRVTREVVDQ